MVLERIGTSLIKFEKHTTTMLNSSSKITTVARLLNWESKADEKMANSPHAEEASALATSMAIDHPSAEEATIEVNMVGGTNDPDDEERPRMPEGKVEPRSQSLDECQRPNAEEEARLEA